MNYLYKDKDSTLNPTAIAIFGMYLLTMWLIVAMCSQPNTPNTLLKPIVYPLNGAILHSDYVPSEIK